MIGFHNEAVGHCCLCEMGLKGNCLLLASTAYGLRWWVSEGPEEGGGQILSLGHLCFGEGRGGRVWLAGTYVRVLSDSSCLGAVLNDASKLGG